MRYESDLVRKKKQDSSLVPHSTVRVRLGPAVAALSNVVEGRVLHQGGHLV